MTRQFKRRAQLMLRNDGETLDLSEMHVQFQIHQAVIGTPNWATIRVFNLSKRTEAKALAEFTHLDLAVGYGDDLTRLFYGQVRQFNAGLRVDAKDTYIDFICQAGDFAINWTVVRKTLAAGWTYEDALGEVSDQFRKNGIKPGYTGPLPVVKFPRGKVLYGAARNHMDKITGNISADWTITNDQLKVVPFGGTLPDQAVVVTSDTGLLGLPQQTVDGITLQMLINPNVQDGSLLKLDNASIQAANIDVAYGAKNYIPGYDDDGLYKVYSINHVGDTRGNDWYSEVICVGLNANTPITDTYITAVPNRTQSASTRFTTRPPEPDNG